MSRDAQSGVTLVETLVAVSLCALVGVAGFTMLETVLRAGDRVDARLERLGELDRAFRVMGRDVGQAAPPALRLEGVTLTLSSDLVVTLADGVLSRRVGDPAVSQTLAGDVSALTWRVLDADRAWHDRWPPPDALPPHAVEARLTLPDGNAVTRLFVLPSGGLP